MYVVHIICEPLVSQPISICISEFPKLATLDLADNANGSSLLEIGSDFYWELVTGSNQRNQGSCGHTY